MILIFPLLALGIVTGIEFSSLLSRWLRAQTYFRGESSMHVKHMSRPRSLRIISEKKQQMYLGWETCREFTSVLFLTPGFQFYRAFIIELLSFGEAKQVLIQ